MRGKPKLMRVDDVAAFIKRGRSHTYHLLTEAGAPPIFENVGPCNFYMASDVKRWWTNRPRERRYFGDGTKR